MDEKEKKDPYNFEETRNALQKRFRVISAKRREYRRKRKRK